MRAQICRRGRDVRQRVAATSTTSVGVRPRRRRNGVAADLRVHQARDRGDQRSRGGRGHHDDPADGHSTGQHDGQDRLRVRPARHRARRPARRGSCRAWSASARPWSGATAVGCSRRTRRWPAAWSGASTSPTSCCRRPVRSPPRSSRTRSPVSIALTRRMLWTMLTADHPMEAHRVDSRAILERGRSAESARASRASWRSGRRCSPIGSATGCPTSFRSR